MDNIPRIHLKRGRKKRAGVVVSILVLIFAIALVLVFTKFQGIENKVFIRSSILNQTAQGYSQSLTDDVSSGTPFNILLLGYGGGNHDGAYLTDSMILVHIDPKLKQTTLISIPRDIWVNIPTNGANGSHWKINAAYELGLDDNDYPHKQSQFKGIAGGGNMVKYVVEQVTGLQIDRFVALDFSGFKKTIDSLGGVSVNVEKTFDDYEYPIDGKENDLCGHPASDLPDLEKISTISATQAFPCRYEHLHFDAGVMHMDGENALSYVRSRHSLQDGTDFGRSNRQRNLLVAVKQRIFSIGFLADVIPFISSLQDDLKTDLSPDELKGFIDQANNLNKYKISNIALTDTNVLKDTFSDDGQAILIPRAGQDNWDAIHSWLAASLDPTLVNSSPIIQVENDTSIGGLATLASNRLADKGLNVLPSTTGLNQEASKSAILIAKGNIDPNILNELKVEFNVQNIAKQQTDNTGYNILIQVGQDYNSLQGKKLIN